MAMQEVERDYEEIGGHYTIRLRCLLIEMDEHCRRADLSKREIWNLLTDGLLAELLAASDALRMDDAAFMDMCRYARQSWKIVTCTGDETRH